jgi:hypothetical protein
MTQVNFGAYNVDAAGQTLQNSGSQFVTDAVVGAHTLLANAMTGGQTNYILVTAAGGVAVTTRTAAQIFADLAAQLGFNPPIGFNFEAVFVNTGGGQITVTAGAGVTVNGTATVANNVSRIFLVTVNGPSQVVMQNVASGTV